MSPDWGGGLGRQARVAGLGKDWQDPNPESLQLSSCCLILSLVYLLKEGSRVASHGDGVSVPSLTPEAPYPAPELFIQVPRNEEEAVTLLSSSCEAETAYPYLAP